MPYDTNSNTPPKVLMTIGTHSPNSGFVVRMFRTGAGGLYIVGGMKTELVGGPSGGPSVGPSGGPSGGGLVDPPVDNVGNLGSGGCEGEIMNNGEGGKLGP